MKQIAGLARGNAPPDSGGADAGRIRARLITFGGDAGNLRRRPLVSITNHLLLG